MTKVKHPALISGICILFGSLKYGKKINFIPNTKLTQSYFVVPSNALHVPTSNQ